eukprot:3660216-Rhodomonas_salina.1
MASAATVFRARPCVRPGSHTAGGRHSRTRLLDPVRPRGPLCTPPTGLEVARGRAGVQTASCCRLRRQLPRGVLGQARVCLSPLPIVVAFLWSAYRLVIQMWWCLDLYVWRTDNCCSVCVGQG